MGSFRLGSIAALACGIGFGALAGPLAPGPTRSEVAGWLGEWSAGPDEVAFVWDEGLRLDLGHLRIPVDGRWHETVPTFAVRHRARWDAARRVVVLDETHDEGSLGRVELHLDVSRDVLVKIAPAAGREGRPVVVRTYRRKEKRR